jgi:hypothetical protein
MNEPLKPREIERLRDDHKPVPWDFPYGRLALGLVFLTYTAVFMSLYYVLDLRDQLRFPEWANISMRIGFLAAIILPFVAVHELDFVWGWWAPRRRLIRPSNAMRWVVFVKQAIDEWDPDDFMSASSETRIRLSDDWKTWNTFGRILYGFDRREEALAALKIAKEAELLYIEQVVHRLDMSEENRELLEQLELIREAAERWHDGELEYANRGLSLEGESSGNSNAS